MIVLEHTYYISGYVPCDEVEHVKNALAILPGVRLCRDSELEDAETPPDRKPPVKLKNNWLFRPFEMFVDMYGLT